MSKVMDKLKVVMPRVFIVGASLMLIGIAASIVASISIFEGSGVLLGVVGGAFGYEKVKELISKLPGLKK